ncbi:MAG TPA: hypothetical protein PLL69_08005 [Gemmatimonadales bacterium]|nr:hypothetical protein [Gemmatimonadales bacterium]
MARIDDDSGRISATILVVGARDSGKSALLRSVRERVPPHRRRGDLDSGLPDPLLDWLALDLGRIGGWEIGADLFAVPTGDLGDATRALLYDECDGLLVVADSQAVRLDDNIAALSRLYDHLADRPGDRVEPPRVYCYGRQDLPEELLLTRDELDATLNRRSAPSFGADLVRGTGVLEALHALISAVVRGLAPRRSVSG